MDRVLVDTGFLVAYGRRQDELYPSADDFLSRFRGTLLTVSAVIVESCYFFDAPAKRRLLEWAEEGSLSVVEVPVAAFSELSTTIRKYGDRNVDFADAALVWLADQTGIRRILTTDRRDFHTYRLKGAKRFELVEWF